jgi:phosphoribosylformylglycinamidine synthase
VLLGGFGRCDARQFGSTQYAKVILNQVWGMPPELDMDYEKRVQAAMRKIAGQGLADSAHDLSDGGLAVAAAECCFGPAEVGARLHVTGDLAPEFLLFHEGPSRILISTSCPEQVLRIAQEYSVEAPVIGTTVEGQLQVSGPQGVFLDFPVQRLRLVWDRALERALKG